MASQITCRSTVCSTNYTDSHQTKTSRLLLNVYESIFHRNNAYIYIYIIYNIYIIYIYGRSIVNEFICITKKLTALTSNICMYEIHTDKWMMVMNNKWNWTNSI